MSFASFVARRKKQWQHFRHLPAGQRFQIHYKEHQQARGQKSKWAHFLGLILIPVFIAIGVVLVFIPGPAILFFFLAAAMLASHSKWVARVLDKAELRLRAAARKTRRWWKASSVMKRVSVILAASVVALGGGVAALELFL